MLRKNSDITAYPIKLTQGDGGVDIIANYKDTQILVQCKDYGKSIGVAKVREFISVLSDHNHPKKLGLMISTNGFSQNCHNLVKDRDILLLTFNDENPDDVLVSIVSYIDGSNFDITRRDISGSWIRGFVRFTLEVDVDFICMLLICLFLSIYSILFLLLIG